MLPVETLNSTAALAATLDAKNLIVRPIPGTNLHKLCEVSSTNDGHVWGENGDLKIMIDNVATDTNRIDTISGTCLHNLEMTELVDTVSDAIAKHLSHTRSVVVPVIEDLVQRTGSSIDQVMKSDQNQLEVRAWRLPEPMYNDALIDSFKRAVDIKPDETLTGAHLPSDASAVQVIEWMKSGSRSLDESIDIYVTSMGESRLMEIYKGMFTTESGHLGMWKMFNDLECGLDCALVGFLVARKLWDSPPEGTSTSLQVYENEMVVIRDQCAVRLCYELDRTDRDEKHGILIRSYSRNTVTVNDSVYRRWLKDGGDISVLFGNVMSARPVLSVNEISENTDSYKQTWDTYCMLQKTTEANKKFALAKEIMAIEFAAMVQTADVAVLPIQDREYAMQRFTDALQVTKECEVQDLYSWAMRLICDSWFYRTDAFQFLDGINRIKAHSPEVDVKEAAAVATLEYIANWIASQFKVDVALR